MNLGIFFMLATESELKNLHQAHLRYGNQPASDRFHNLGETISSAGSLVWIAISNLVTALDATRLWTSFVATQSHRL